MKLFGGTYNLHDKHVHVHCFFILKKNCATALAGHRAAI